MKKVLVIVVTYNGRHWLSRCLGSVPPAAGASVKADLWVLDNDSTDGCADYVQKEFPLAKLVRSAENLGFTGGNNLGIEYALRKGYDYVYLLNQDAWLEEGALARLVEAAEAHPDYAVLSPLQMTDGYAGYDRLFGQALGRARKAGPDGIRRLPFVMAAHWLVPCAALREIGPFSALFPYYGQDDDWCNRARFHGYGVGVLPAARAVHDRACRKESRERIIDRNYRVGSLVRLCDINRPLWERFLFVCLFTVVKAVKYRSLLPFRHFASLCRQLPEVRAHRAASRRKS